MWSPPETPAPLFCKGLEFDMIRPPTAKVNADNAERLHQFAMANLEALRLTEGPTVSVRSFRPIKRIGPDGQLKLEIVAELMQEYESVPLDPEPTALSSPAFRFLGGTTIVLDAEGSVLYGIGKALGTTDSSNPRLQRQRGYYSQLDSVLAAATYEMNTDADHRPISALDTGTFMRFDIVHRGF